MPRLFLGLAIVLLLVAVGTFVKELRFVRGAERATGTVIDLSSSLSEGSFTYYPIVRFTTAEGRTVEFQSPSGSSSPPDVGDRVEVLYDPDNPRDAQLSGFFDIWLWPIVSGTLGFLFAFFGLFAPRFGILAGRVRWPPWSSPRAAGLFIVSALALAGSAGCGLGEAGAGLVESHVRTYEGDDAEVKSCREIGDAIADDGDYGATLHEVWRCAVDRPGEPAEFADACYVVNDEVESAVVRGIRCALVGPGCPPGGPGDRKGETAFLGRVIDPELVLERARGNEPAYETIRVDVSYQPDGKKERCGYLSVRVPPADDPMRRAAERVEANGWTEPHYHFAYAAGRA
jgi:Protein of unknown function (DUF3592)